MLHTRRQFLLALAGVATVGCARDFSLRSTKAPGGGSEAAKNSLIRRDTIESIGVPCIAVTLGDNTVSGLMFLTHYDGEDLRWESTNRVRFLTRGGRLIVTHGLRRDLIATRYDSADPLLQTQASTIGVFTRSVDLSPGDHREVRYESVLTTGKEETLTILETSYQVARIHETLTVPRWNWRAENVYWRETSTGLIRRSIQHIAADTPAITIDLLKPPA